MKVREAHEHEEMTQLRRQEFEILERLAGQVIRMAETLVRNPRHVDGPDRMLPTRSKCRLPLSRQCCRSAAAVPPE